MMEDQNRQDWLRLWGKLEAKGDPIEAYENLLLRYSEKHRTYHNIQHIRNCLDEFYQIWIMAENHLAIELAIWFHDVVYNPLKKNNEKESAILALGVMKTAGLSGSFAQTVFDLIMATKHFGKVEGIDAQILVDVDLSILGQSEDIFDQYEAAVRQEYSWVPQKVFSQGRVAILEYFLAPGCSIYQTPFFQKKYEAQARRNIRRSIALLQKA